jgi:hypothetical protein
MLLSKIPFLKFGTLICLMGTFSSLQAVEISPSKYQGGNSNNIPNRTSEAPTLLHNPTKWIFGSGHSSAMKRVQAPPNLKVDLLTEPKNFTPSTNGVLKARMVVVNKGDDKCILQFESAKHYDFVINNKNGQEVYRYSADKEFSRQVSSMVLNRNEKLVYEQEIASSEQQVKLPPGDYTLTGQVIAKNPILVETSFQVVR